MRSIRRYVLHCYGKRYYEPRIIILSLQIPRLIIVIVYEQQNLISGIFLDQCQKKNNFVHTTSFFNDIKCPRGFWWVNLCVNTNSNPRFQNFRSSRSKQFFFRTDKS